MLLVSVNRKVDRFAYKPARIKNISVILVQTRFTGNVCRTRARINAICIKAMCPASTNTGFNSDVNLYRCEPYKQRVLRLPIKILCAMIIEKIQPVQW